ncbi:hypothetical protein [Muriicola marianensis]|uniref:Uncharacterized protein n=1 Tax=Muriicola marianensis TaxID=1324801 RepID=A0ABQ1QRQ8_9FLAO|nr:hypothetical protein [Muriicola marianensis]GGD41475.1 hypothetical protein GCM10011361_05700 [Muriicola marianensis]
MSAHTIYLFATTNNPSPPYMSQDGGATWSNTDDADFTTEVDAGDTVQWRFDLNMNGQTNNISAINSISPTTYFKPSKSPNASNQFTGTINSGNPPNGVQPYTIRYNVTGAGPQSQDPKIQMK